MLAMLEIFPKRATVMLGLAILIVGVLELRPTPFNVPFKVKVHAPALSLSKRGVPAKLMLLPIDRLASTMSLAPEATATCPEPIGPVVSPAPPWVGEVLALSITAPALRLKPPVKVLLPESLSTPLPVLVTAMPGLRISAVIANVGCKVERTTLSRSTAGTSMVLVPEVPRLIEPAMVGILPRLLELTLMGVAPVKVSRPPEVTVGLPLPPLLLKVMLASEFAPTKVSVELAFKVTLVLAAIWPAFVNMVTVPLVRVRPPAGMTTSPAVVPRSSKVPSLTVVPPV